MTKPITFDPKDRERLMRRIRQHPKVMWIKTEKGDVKALDPYMDYNTLTLHFRVGVWQHSDGKCLLRLD